MSSFAHSSSRKTQNKKNPKDAIKELNELFGSVLKTDIIRSVANCYNYDVHRSSNVLIEMSSGIQNNGTIKKQPQKNGNGNGNNKNSPSKRCPQQSKLNKIQHSQSTNNIPNKSRKQIEIERVIKRISEGVKVLVILRGMPGSGKSWLAKNILDSSVPLTNYRDHILSTDDYFLDKGGFYVYEPNKLNDAHNWNHRRAFKAMSNGLSPVIIDNTNTQMWEMKPYVTMATDWGYFIEILEPDTWWCFNDKELTKRNIHNVPKVKIKEMIERYEKNVTPQKILLAYSLVYKLNKPPQLRKAPPIGPPKSQSMTIIKDNNNGPDLIDFDNNIKNQTTTNNLIDWFNNGEDTTTNILQPLNKINDDIKNLKIVDNDLETAWGIDVKALQSWDIVTPINEDLQPFPVFKFNDLPLKIIETKDNGTHMDENDFVISKNAFIPDGYKVIQTNNRDINYGVLPKPPNIPKKITINQSSMTDEILPTVDGDLDDLIKIFPNIPKSHLKDIFEKCQRNIDWAIEVLLEDNNHTILEEKQETEEETKPTELLSSSPSSSSSSSLSFSCGGEDLTEYSQDKKAKKPTSEEALELKKCIESKIDIDKKHYSNHVLKVKQYKFGLVNEPQIDENQPSISNYKNDSESDEDFEKVDYEDVDTFNPKQSVELNLGDNFVAQLETLFGSITPQGFQPIVQIPRNLALQLYTFYIESVYQQMDNQNQILENLIREDEEFARKLQRQEEEQENASQVVQPQQASGINLNEIMDEQIALNIYRRDTEKWKDMTADNLAAKLTREKLFKIFPMIDKNTLIEILHAYNNNYNKTVEVLLESTEGEAVTVNNIVKEPPISETVLTEMKHDEKDLNEDNNDDENDEHPPLYYREQANKHLQKRQQLYEKAQSYYQRGMLDVAHFYSELAKKETQSYDKANNLAAVAFLDENSRRLQKFDTIDLHFLYVKEAIQALDVFIDKNINLLKNNNRKQTQSLMIITGRGNNSYGGVSKIKPAVMSRLKKRKIGYSILNPGLLRIKITHHTLMGHELP